MSGICPKGAIVVVSSLFAVLLWVSPLNAQTSGNTWGVVGRLGQPRYSFGLRAVSPDRVLVVGGYSKSSSANVRVPIASCEVIDVKNRTVSSAVSLNVAHAEAVTLQNGDSNLVVVGGVGAGNTLTPLCEYYDRSPKTWRVLGSLLIARRNHMATFISNDEILVAGGVNSSGQPVAETEIFNVKTGRSRITARLPLPLAAGACSVSIGFAWGKAVIIGGRDANNISRKEIYSYNEKKQKWEWEDPYPHPISDYYSLRLFDGRLALFGTERRKSSLGRFAQHSILGIEANPQFRTLETTARTGGALAQWNNDSLLILGGKDTMGINFRETEWVDLLTGRHFPAPTPFGVHYKSEVISLPAFDDWGNQKQSRILVVSGIGGDGSLNGAVELLERTDTFERLSAIPHSEQTSLFSFVSSAVSVNTFLLITAVISVLIFTLLYLVRALRLQIAAEQERRRIEQERSRVQYEKEQLQAQAATLRLRTLHLQMKPHFVYNSLAAVELLVLEQKNEMASHYIRILAKLFRMVLEHSDNSTVTIKEAVEFLHVYTALEQLRTGHSFEYQIRHTLSQRQLLRFIPSMLIQPYIENAVKYGIGLLPDFCLRHSLEPREGNIIVELSYKVEKQKEYLLCAVEDNGVGREVARATYAKSRYSYQGLSRSTNINAERLSLLTALDDHVENVQYEDLTSSDGIPLGTRVTMRIPILSTTMDE